MYWTYVVYLWGAQSCYVTCNVALEGYMCASVCVCLCSPSFWGLVMNWVVFKYSYHPPLRKSCQWIWLLTVEQCALCVYRLILLTSSKDGGSSCSICLMYFMPHHRRVTLCSLFKFSNYILDPPLIITHVIIIISVIIITVSTWNSLSNEKRW